MKKLFTLLAALLIVSSAFAIKPNMQKVQLNPNSEINKNLDILKYFELANSGALGNENRPMRFTFEMDGQVWNAEVLKGSWTWADRLVFTDENGQQAQFDFEEFPFYDVAVYVYNSDLNNFEQYTYDLFYPCKFLAGLTEETAPDALDITPLEYWSDDSLPFVVMDAGYGGSTEESWGAWFQTYSYKGANATQYFNKPGSSLTFSNFDKEEMSMNITIKGSLLDAQQTPVAGSDFFVPYAGVFEQNGFYAKNFDLTWSNVHIYNAGSVDGNSWYWYDDTDWGPLNRFVIYALGEGFIVDETIANEIPNPNNQGGLYVKDASYQQLYRDDPTNLAFSFAYGAFYAPNGADSPEGWYPAAHISYAVQGNYTVSVGTPEVNKCIISDYLNSQNADMFAGIYYDDNLQLAYGNKSIELATEGVGVKVRNSDGTGIVGKDSYNNNVKMLYTGDIVYHYDPSDYTKTQKLAAVDKDNMVNGVVADANATVEAANGLVVVKAAEDVNVVIYNAAGVAVKSVKVAAGETATIEAGNGLFIVKAGNVVKKVAL